MKEWFKKNAIPALFMACLVVATWLWAVTNVTAGKKQMHANELKFEHETGIVFNNKHCDGDDYSKICWFKIPVFSPAFGCKSTITAIYKCTPHECTWLEEP